jgi:cell division transport system permease protein
MKFRFFLGETFESLRRNWVMTIASVLTVFISMAILGAVLVINENLDQGATSLKNRVLIEVFILDEDEGGTPEKVKALSDRIADMPEVKTFTYISKDQALEEFRKKLGADADAILNNLTTNPLPASYRIYVNDADQVDTVAARFFDDPVVDNDPGTHNGVRYAKETVRKMLGTINLVEKGMWVVTGVFSVAAVLLISTTVRLSIFSRRREIEIMQLVGATKWFIRWPFVLEGFFTGCLGSLLAAGAVWGLNWFVVNWVTNSNLEFIKPVIYGAWFQGGAWPLGMVPTLALLGAVLGAVGSAVALRRYLHV